VHEPGIERNKKKQKQRYILESGGSLILNFSKARLAKNMLSSIRTDFMQNYFKNTVFLS
jgi:hypothetical protein